MTDKELINELWKMWDALAIIGEIGIAPGWPDKYDKLKIEVDRINERIDSSDSD